MREMFTGQILGVGTASGHRIVVGDWWTSPFGAFADVMVAEPSGHRILLAPSAVIAEYVCATYHFDERRVVTVQVDADHPALTVAAGPLHLQVTVGRRAGVGYLLRAVPGRLSRSPLLARVADPVARRVMPGVRTHGSAGGGRYEYYGARDLHHVTDLRARWDDTDLGALAPVDPPPDFGFSSSPRFPSLTAVTTTVVRT